MERAERWVHRYGLWLAFLGRLIPGVRTYISLSLGVGRVQLTAFILLTTAGSFIWSLFLAYVGFKLGEAWQQIHEPFKYLEIVIVLGALGLVGWLIWRRQRDRNSS